MAAVNAGVGVAQQPAVIFDGPHAGLLQSAERKRRCRRTRRRWKY